MKRDLSQQESENLKVCVYFWLHLKSWSIIQTENKTRVTSLDCCHAVSFANKVHIYECYLWANWKCSYTCDTVYTSSPATDQTYTSIFQGSHSEIVVHAASSRTRLTSLCTVTVSNTWSVLITQMEVQLLKRRHWNCSVWWLRVVTIRFFPHSWHEPEIPIFCTDYLLYRAHLTSLHLLLVLHSQLS